MIKINSGNINGMKVSGNSKRGFDMKCGKCGHEKTTKNLMEAN
tara:strand:- start:442 stop:570 length:129 start_codon:yes stop_codon:yes gene_type:complete